MAIGRTVINKKARSIYEHFREVGGGEGRR
jgi:hypothetical protein